MGFFDTDFGSPIPWMADVSPGIWVNLELKIHTLTPVESEVPFGKGFGEKLIGGGIQMGTVTEATAEMQNIQSIDGVEMAEDGEHTIPFWACAALQGYLEPQLKQLKGKWVKLSYKREVMMRKGKENSVAEFAEQD